MQYETAFLMDTSSIKFGAGATREVGFDMKSLGARRVMVLVDPNLVHSQTCATVMQALKDEGIDAVLYSAVRIEPSDASFKEAIRFASDGKFDGYVAVGGGSTMDTAKAANLYATYPADFLTYVNAPIGKGQPPPGRLQPMIAIPTTAGTGSETTGTAICDLLDMHVKTGIAHRFLRPQLGIIDPENTRSLPRMVAACSGLDVLCHALESLLALPYNQRPAPETPAQRPAYQGANPISHIWASKAIEICTKFLPRVLEDPNDDEARGQMLLAASFAGIGFGNAGVTLPHGMSYPISGKVRNYYPPDYPHDHPMVPHGMSVILGAPAAFRFTAPSNPRLHLYAASLMGVDTRGARDEDAGDLLAGAVIEMMKKTGMPNGLKAVGFGMEDIEDLVAGALPQHRVLKLSPRAVSAEDLTRLFMETMTLW
ncbi:MAG: iron-containing alcohol dehydrogenase [Anaerolineae bacterium]|nr:iron-containing alcohol dehydrogenase [Anaerolineae bacterium]